MTKNVRTVKFKELFGKLPESVKKLARAAYRLFRKNPSHPSLHLHDLKDNKKGQHRDSSKAVSVSAQYRAIFVVEGDTNVWYWIGTHNDYNTFTGRK